MKKLLLILLYFPVIGFIQEGRKIYFDTDINTLSVSKNFDNYTGIDTENVFYSIKTSYLTVLMDNLGISKPHNTEIHTYTVPDQYKKIKHFVCIIETN